MIKFRTFLFAGVASTGLLTTAAYALSQAPLTTPKDSTKHGQTSSPSQSTNSAPPIPNSDSNYLDDKLEWEMPVYVYPTGSDGIDLNAAFCLPAKTPVIGLDSKYTTGTPPGDTTAQNYLPVRLSRSLLAGNKVLITAAQTQPDKDSDKGVARCDHVTPNLQNADSQKLSDTQFPIFDDTQFYVSANDLDHLSTRKGWDFGTLIVPFKFQMSDKSIVTGSSSLGGYVGYDFGINVQGFRIRPVAFVGISDISLPDSGGAGSKKPSSETVGGISYGVGMMGTIKDSFNISLVFGADHASSKTYQYQDKPWVSLALGYSFTK